MVTFGVGYLVALGVNLGLPYGLARSLLAVVAAPRWFHALGLLLRLCIEGHDAKGFGEAVVDVSSWEHDAGNAGGMTSALWTGTLLWWDELQESDAHAISYALVPEGAAQACLARWRLGTVVANDPEAMARGAQANPDAASEFALAEGAALLGLGRAQEAVARIGQLIARLEPLSRDDFAEHQVLDLAEAIHAKALLAAGERRLALAEARTLRPTLRPGLLPRILVDEVLHAEAPSVR